MASARETALEALIMCRRDGAWADAALSGRIEKNGLDARDGALASRLCFCVLQNRMWIDFIISKFCSTKPEKLEPVVLDILRIGVCQLLFMDKIPASAAVSEAVSAAKRHSNPRAAGLVNAVLRAVSRNIDSLPEPDGDKTERLSIKYSHPLRLCRKLSETAGDGLEALLEANNSTPATVAQVNTLRCGVRDALSSLEADGVQAEPHPWLPDCLLLLHTGNITKLKAFKDGLIYIQDAAARLAVEASGASPGDLLLDGCAAPGGKSFAAAVRMGNSGRIVAGDIHKHKIRLIEKGAERLGISIIEARLHDARKPELFDSADVVLADVPCSGFGIIRKKPDIRYKNMDELAPLPGIQLDILRSLSKCVRPGGVLLYSTCTLLRDENEDVAEAFLRDAPEFSAEDFSLLDGKLESRGGMLTLMPHIHGTDGFFICKMRRGPE